jgi:hypothetical protein
VHAGDELVRGATLFAALPLRELTAVFGKSEALLIPAVFSGLSHYTSTLGGPVSVLLTGILDWVLAKLVIETRSIVAAWIGHFPSILSFSRQF